MAEESGVKAQPASTPGEATPEKPAAPATQEPERMVSLKALQEERSRRQEAQQQLSAAAERERAYREMLTNRQPAQDPTANLRRPFAEGAQSDEDRQRADKAFEAVQAVAKATIAEERAQMEREFGQRMETLVNGRFSALNETLTANNMLTKMVTEGRMSRDEAQVVNQRVEDTIQAQPDWGKHRSLLTEKVVGGMFANGEIQMRTANPQPSFPGGPGSPGHRQNADNSKQERTEKLKEAQGMFRSLRAVDLATLDGIMPKSSHAVTPVIDRETGQQVSLDSDLVSGAFTHSRAR